MVEKYIPIFHRIKGERVYSTFKTGIKILVATDILSRGIDIEDIDLCYKIRDVPNDGEDYDIV